MRPGGVSELVCPRAVKTGATKRVKDNQNKIAFFMSSSCEASRLQGGASRIGINRNPPVLLDPAPTRRGAQHERSRPNDVLARATAKTTPWGVRNGKTVDKALILQTFTAVFSIAGFRTAFRHPFPLTINISTGAETVQIKSPMCTPLALSIDIYIALN
jgi:hypothetical protein